MNFKDKEKARWFFQSLTQATKDWNRLATDTDEFKALEDRMEKMLTEVTDYA
jgi:V/A-type H+-transporting ATPase subunit A